MAHLSTIKMLIAWAKWGAGHSIDYPSLSPMFGERALKSPLYGANDIPPDVMEVEEAVCRLDWEDRQVLVLRYQRHMNFPAIAERMGLSRWSAKPRLKRAEDAVEYEINCAYAPKGIYLGSSSKTD